MPYRRRSIVLAEIERQCRFAMTAYQEAAAAAEVGDEGPLWYSLEALLGAAAHLHQLLWPRPNPSVAWAAELRAALAIDLDSPLARQELVSVFDFEALMDEWILHPEGAARWFDRELSTVHYYGRVFELAPLLSAIADLDARTLREVQHMREVV
jgi:hypothetical protein